MSITMTQLNGRIKAVSRNLSNNFYTPREQPPHDGVNNPHYTNATLAQIYSLYDELIASNPTYITKTILGKDQSGTHDVWRLDFKPRNPEFKIILGAGIHWEWANHIITLFNFMREICGNWESDEILNFLRWKVHIVVMPVENPYGLANKQRHNVNMVDVNRNFGYEWDAYTDDDAANPASYFYKGSAAFSEIESRHIRGVLLANRDALLYYSFHMEVLQNRTFRYYVATGKKNTVYDTIMNTIDKMNYTYPSVGEDYLSVTELPNAFNYAEKVLGIYSANPENTQDSNNPDFSSYVSTRELTWYSNLVWALIKKKIDVSLKKDTQWENKIVDSNYESADNYETPNPAMILSVEKNKLACTHTSAVVGSALRTTDLPMISGHKYYIRATVSVNNVTNVTDIRLYGRSSVPTSYDISTKTSPSIDTKYTLSGIINAVANMTAAVRVTGTGNLINGFKMTLHADDSNGFMLIDLGTASNPSYLYNESVSEIEKHIVRLGNYWKRLPQESIKNATDSILFAGRTQSQYPAVDTYTGDGVVGGKVITTNFQPKKITIFDSNGAVVLNWCTGMTLTNIVASATGFTVKGTCNTSASVYYYEVF